MTDKGRVIAARADGAPVTVGGIEKMSKSKNNGVDPQAMIDAHGADAVRLFTLFAAPPDQSLEWSDAGLEGANRFLKRLWRVVHEHAAGGPAPALDKAALNDAQRALRAKVHATLRKVGDDMARRMTYNTAIAAVMEMMNAVGRFEDAAGQSQAVRQEALERAVLMLAPIVPHICHRLWRVLGHETSVVAASWPTVDETALIKDRIELVVQVNGKLRGKIQVPADAAKETVEAAALAEANVARFIAGKTVRKRIVVPGRLVNLVVADA